MPSLWPEDQELTAGLIASQAKAIALDQGCQLPFPGQGRTYERWLSLMSWAREDLCLAKLLESHYDALAILNEAHRQPEFGLYAVWASKFGGQGLTAEILGSTIKVKGKVAFASGVHAVDYALIPAQFADGERLLEIPRELMIHIDGDHWPTSGMALADTAWITVEGVVPKSAMIGEPGFYLNRFGFWPGGMGVAACWLAAAEELFNAWQKAARGKNYIDPHDAAKRGHAYSLLVATTLAFEREAARLDQLQGRREDLKSSALMLRHLADHLAGVILSESLQSQGPGLLLANNRVAKRYHDLQIFIRQCHAEKDLAALTEELDRNSQRSKEESHVEHGRIRSQSRSLVHSLG